jgi:hypothetical protein
MTTPTKPFELTFEDRTSYLYARVNAETIDRPNALKYLKEVADRCNDTGCERLMLCRDIPVMLSDADLFFTTTDFLKMIGTTRVAFVNPHAEIAKEMDFAILIGSNRGGNYKLFNNEFEAETWLTSQ